MLENGLGVPGMVNTPGSAAGFKTPSDLLWSGGACHECSAASLSS